MKSAVYAGIALLLVFGVYTFFIKKDTSGIYIASSSKKTILLYKESGQVSIRLHGDQVITPVASNKLEIDNLTEVITGSSSRASVLLPDNSMISLSENTDITINYTDYSTSIFQSLGSTYHRVQKLVSGRTYEVQTPSTLAAVRGTKFAVMYDGANKKTKIAVTESKVAVSRIKKEEGTSTSSFESPILVEEGNMVKVTAYTPAEDKKEVHMEVSGLHDDADVSLWTKENKSGDIIFDEVKTETKDGDGDTFRTKMDNQMESKIKNNLNKDVSKKDGEEIKDDKKDTPPQKDTTTDTPDTPKVVKKVIEVVDTKPTTDTTDTPKVNKAKVYASDEDFTNAFDDLLIKYLYIDDQEAICQITLSPEARAKEIGDLATANGHPFSTDKILALAQKVVNYCTLGSNAKDRAIIQSEFDDVVPSF